MGEKGACVPSVVSEAVGGGGGAEVTRQYAPETCQVVPFPPGVNTRAASASGKHHGHGAGAMRTGGGRVRVNQGTLLGAFSCQVSFPSLLPAVACLMPDAIAPRGRAVGHPEAPHRRFQDRRAQSDDSL